MLPRMLMLVMALGLVSPSRVMGQDTSSVKVGQQKRWVVSFSGGTFFGGARSDLKQGMLDSGFDDQELQFEQGVIFDAELAYFIYPNFGLALNGGLASRLGVRGYESFAGGNPSGIEGNTMEIKTELWRYSLAMVIVPRSARMRYYLGPSVMVARAWVPETDQAMRIVKPGIYLAYALDFIQKKNWFLGGKLGVAFLGGEHFGPFTVGEVVDGSEEYLSTFEDKKTCLTTLNLELNFGFAW